MEWRTRVSTDPAVCHGNACIKGTRIMVSVVLDNLAQGKSADKIVQLYPTLQREDVAAAIAYAAELACERDRDDDGVAEALRRDAELDAHPERAISFEELDTFIRSRRK